MGSSFTKLRLFFHKVSSIISTLFPPSRKTLYAGRAKLCWTSQLFTRAVFPLAVVRKSLECTLQGAQIHGSQRVLNRDRREAHPPPHWYSCLLCVQIRVRSGVIRGRTILIRCFNFFSVCTYRSELIVTPLSKNSTNNIPWLSQKALAITLPADVCTLNI
jgi:hypothetical protein